MTSLIVSLGVGASIVCFVKARHEAHRGNKKCHNWQLLGLFLIIGLILAADLYT